MPANFRISFTCDERTYDDIVIALTLRILDPTCTEVEAKGLAGTIAAIVNGAFLTSITDEVPDAPRI